LLKHQITVEKHDCLVQKINVSNDSLHKKMEKIVKILFDSIEKLLSPIFIA